MKESTIEKTEKLLDTMERFSQAMDKIPRMAEMLGVAMFAGRASERVGGKFIDGAIGGIVADGLAHSQLPNNQIGGVALAVYFSAIGFLNILPFGPPTITDPLANVVGAGGTVLDPANVYSGLGTNEKIMGIKECGEAGGTVVRVVPQSALCVCALPVVPEQPKHYAYRECPDGYEWNAELQKCKRMRFTLKEEIR